MRSRQHRRRSPQQRQHRCLRWVQLALYSAACAFSIVVCAALRVAMSDMNGECPLYARPVKVELSPGRNGTHLLKLEGGVKTGEMKTCYYAMYLAAVTAAFSLAWGLLYALLSATPSNGATSVAVAAAGARNRLAWLLQFVEAKFHLRRLIFPSLLFNSVLFTSQLIASCVLTLGHGFWCKGILRELEDSEVARNLAARRHEQALPCSFVQSMSWTLDGGGANSDGNSGADRLQGAARYLYFREPRYQSLITAAQLASWTVSFILLVLSCVCGERFFRAVWFGEFEGDGDGGDSDSSGDESTEAPTTKPLPQSGTQPTQPEHGISSKSFRNQAAGSMSTNGFGRENLTASMSFASSLKAAAAAEKLGASIDQRATNAEPLVNDIALISCKSLPTRRSQLDCRPGEETKPLWEPRVDPDPGSGSSVRRSRSQQCRFCSPGCRGRGCSVSHGQL